MLRSLLNRLLRRKRAVANLKNAKNNVRIANKTLNKANREMAMTMNYPRPRSNAMRSVRVNYGHGIQKQGISNNGWNNFKRTHKWQGQGNVYVPK
jgi:hypothetical protein